MNQPKRVDSIVDEETGELRISELTNGELRIRYILGENPGEAQVVITWVYDDSSLAPIEIRVDDTTATGTGAGRTEYQTCLQDNVAMGVKAIVHCLPQLFL